jgi:hypothetical protein
MIEQELKAYLVEINQHLAVIRAKKNPGIWRAFFNGMFSALGYIAGLALIIVVFGWVLQKSGLLKPFQDQLKNFTQLIEGAKKLLPSDQNTSGTNDTLNKGETTVILPDGRQVKVVLPQ